MTKLEAISTAPETAPTRTVLVVDDSRMQRRILSTSLRKWGYDVLEAESGMEALEICENSPVPMVISDWMMPGMTGPEFCKTFRKLGADNYGYFLLLTSKNTSDEIAEGLNSGADDFLTKPVNFGELRARLRAGDRILQMQAELTRKNELINASLQKSQSLYAALERDLKEARNLQQSLVPEIDEEFDSGRVSMMLKPCGHVGGDLVGKFRISKRELGLFSLDVSGHGVSSALMTARLAASLNGQTPAQNVAMTQKPDGEFVGIDPAEAARTLNEMLLREIDTEHYFTLALSIVDLETGSVKAVQAGHPPPIVFGNGKAPRRVGDGGMPIGLLPGADYQSFDFTLEPGERLLLYSDGITEAENPRSEFLDEEGLEKFVMESCAAQGPEFLADLLHKLCEFAEWADFNDDVSALVFDYKGPSASPLISQAPDADRSDHLNWSE